MGGAGRMRHGWARGVRQGWASDTQMCDCAKIINLFKIFSGSSRAVVSNLIQTRPGMTAGFLPTNQDPHLILPVQSDDVASNQLLALDGENCTPPCPRQTTEELLRLQNFL